jgi:hypothetical protein
LASSYPMQIASLTLLVRDAALLVCILAATYFPGRFPREYRRRAWVSRPCSGWERVGHQHYDHQKSVRGEPMARKSSRNLGFLSLGGRGAPFLAVRRSLFPPAFTNRRTFLCAILPGSLKLLPATNPLCGTLRYRVHTLVTTYCPHASLLPLVHCWKSGRKDTMRVGCKNFAKALGHLVRVSSTCHHASTSRLSTRSSTGDLTC